jgi:hypothetical protein
MKKLLALAAVAAAGYGAWHFRGQTEPTKDNELVRDRFWVDHLPRNEREPIQTFVILKEQGAGLFNNASMWRGSYELFRYEMQGSQIRMEFPQTGDRETARAQATRCNERGMDFCLKLEGSSRGAKQYYSKKGWEVRSLDDARAKLDAIEHE